MEKKRVVPAWVTVIMLVLCFACLLANIVALGGQNITALSMVSTLVIVLAGIMAVFYCILGYKKEGSTAFYAFSVVFTLAIFLQIIVASAFESVMPIVIVLLSVSFACLFTLTIAKDLGNTKSYCLVGANVICSLVIFLIPIIADKSQIMYVITSPVSTALVLSLIYGIMIYAKYQDKEARGTK